MTQRQRDLYSAYVYNERTRLEADVKELQATLRYRPISSVDCLELIIAQERLNDFTDFVRCVNAILCVEQNDGGRVRRKRM